MFDIQCSFEAKKKKKSAFILCGGGGGGAVYSTMANVYSVVTSNISMEYREPSL